MNLFFGEWSFNIFWKPNQMEVHQNATPSSMAKQMYFEILTTSCCHP